MMVLRGERGGRILVKERLTLTMIVAAQEQVKDHGNVVVFIESQSLITCCGNRQVSEYLRGKTRMLCFVTLI